ncbi:MAG: hypothetical protein IT537_31220 [Hyphomicrobiales bacterium]|nr:hypothetical protein [Hyphomicrobiales bacterium]
MALLESLRWGRREFAERLCRDSASQAERTLDILRLEAAYHFAELFYLLRARGIETAEDVEVLAELHNAYIVGLTKDAGKMARLGLKLDRLLDAMFTADTMPRLLQTWRASSGAIDQSNLARLLVTVMSTETCRKLVVACADAGFLARERTPFGTMVVRSTGTLERIFGACLREMRQRVEGAR